MRAKSSSAVAQYTKVAPEGRGRDGTLGSLLGPDTVDPHRLTRGHCCFRSFYLCAGASAYFLHQMKPRLALCGVACLSAGLLLLMRATAGGADLPSMCWPVHRVRALVTGFTAGALRRTWWSSAVWSSDAGNAARDTGRLGLQASNQARRRRACVSKCTRCRAAPDDGVGA